MARLCQWLHTSHERRRQRINAMLALLQDYAEDEHRDHWTEGVKYHERTVFFDTCVAMAAVTTEYETHRDVKDRMWFIIDLCDMFDSRIDDIINKDMKWRTAPKEPPEQELDELPF